MSICIVMHCPVFFLPEMPDLARPKQWQQLTLLLTLFITGALPPERSACRVIRRGIQRWAVCLRHYYKGPRREQEI